MKSLDTYDVLPEEMRRYLSQYGFHFSKRAFEHAVRLMRRKNRSTGMMESVPAVSKEKLDELLAAHNIKIDSGSLYDAAYVYNMVKADYWGSSIEDERHALLYVKDTLDDPDGNDELPFRYWLQKMVAVGRPVDWESMM